ncbi:MAG: hypothetical protein ABJB39_10375, partial [Chloroflexota bacterium]
MFGRGSLTCGPLGGRALGGALCGCALRERALRFGATLRRLALGGGAFGGGAFGRGLFRGGAKLFLRAPLFGGASLPDRALERCALLGRALFFLGPSHLCGTPLFFRALLVLSTTLRRGALLRIATRRGRTLLFEASLGRGLFRRGALR